MSSIQEDPYGSDDSDIEEVAIISAKSVTPSPRCASPVAKRRKSSPQMDPIPNYIPTPIHLLESQSKSKTTATSSYYTGSDFSPSYELYSYEGSADSTEPQSSTSAKDEYTPLLHPNPDVVAYNIDESPPQVPTTSDDQIQEAESICTQLPETSKRIAHKTSGIPSSTVSLAVARRRRQSSRNVTNSDTNPSEAPVQKPSPSDYAEKPVMWSPKLPSQIEPVKDEQAEREKAKALEASKQQMPRGPKTRIAHKPTIPQNKHKRPKVPIGASKKVPLPYRTKYLDVIITEYLNTGHNEEESYEKALKEEQGIALRAANRNIYVNLVAGLKKKIRESAANPNKPG